MRAQEKRIDTLIELYDSETHLYNALGTMLFRPRRVIFLIPERDAVIYEKYKDAYMQIWRSHRCLPEITESVLTRTDDFLSLSNVISQYIKTGIGAARGNTVLDIAGGSPSLYIAAGYIYARMPSGVVAVKPDFAAGRLTEYVYNPVTGKTAGASRDFTDEERDTISLCVDECIRIYGGRIKGDTISDLLSSGMTRAQIYEDVTMLWDAASPARQYWNYVIPDRIHVINEGSLLIYVNGNDIKSNAVSATVTALLSAGMISACGIDGARYLYKCKSHCVMKCLRKAGELLELYMNTLAASVPGVTDAICGVSLDYDGEDGRADNEIDGIFIRGGIPVFVSCKNGRVSSDELYKFNTVCRQFGGCEKVSILAAPNFMSDDDEDLQPGAQNTAQSKKIARIRERAELYNIKILSKLHDVSRDELTDEIDRLSR